MDSAKEDVLCRLPKVELHAHLNGSISLKTIRKLLSTKAIGSVAEDFVLQQPESMDGVFRMFPLVQSLTEAAENLALATRDVISEFHDEGVVYLELRTTPKNTKFMDKELYIQTVIDAIKSSNENQSTLTTLILSIDRRQSTEEASQTVDLAINDGSGLIVGIELSGDPNIDGRKFLPQLRRARDAGLGVSLHLAEVEDNLDEVDEFLDFSPDRIGHGTFLHTRPEFVSKVVDKQILIEICLTSNEMCKTARISESHFDFWRSKVPVAICTDDKGLMGCPLTDEFRKARDAFNLSLEDLRKISFDSFRCSFISKKFSSDFVDTFFGRFFVQ